MNDSPYYPAYSKISPLSQATLRSQTSARLGPELRTETLQIPRSTQVDELARIFNTVMVATLAQQEKDFSGAFSRVMESAPFRAILASVEQHARAEGISLKQAADEVIQTFRKMDELWRSYTCQEGVDRLSGGLAETSS